MDRTIEEEARQWFLTLRATPTDAEIMAWEEWLAVSAAQPLAYDRAVELWEAWSAAERLTAGKSDRELAPLAPRRARGGVRALALAASIAATMGIGTVGYRLLRAAPAASDAPDDRIVLLTARGEHRSAQLTDGSEVTVGGSTQLATSLSATARNATLTRGQMFVKVAKDRRRPFIVRAANTSITAVGTAFDVDVQDHDIIVNVLHGLVLVQTDRAGRGEPPRRATTYVRAGTSLVVTEGGQRLAPGMSGDGGRPAWIGGHLEYRDAALGDVLRDVNRYSPIPIVAANDRVGGLHYTGSIDVNRIRPWLTGLTEAFGLRMRDTPAVILLDQKNAHS